jgi:hypothetical protein
VQSQPRQRRKSPKMSRIAALGSAL